MSRKGKTFTGEQAAVASTYAKATNQIDLGSDADAHSLKVFAKTATAEGVWGYVVVSPTELSDVDAADALAVVAQRVRFYIADESVVGCIPFQHVFDGAFRFVYFLTSTGTADLSVIAEQA